MKEEAVKKKYACIFVCLFKKSLKSLKTEVFKMNIDKFKIPELRLVLRTLQNN